MRARLRNSLVFVAGIALWIAQLAIGTFLILRMTPVGDLFSDMEAVRRNEQSLSHVVAAYGDPLALLTTTFPRLLMLLSLAASLVTGCFVGAFVSPRAWWVPVLTGIGLVATPLVIEPSSRVVWLSLCAFGATAAAAGLLTMVYKDRCSQITRNGTSTMRP